MPSQKQKAIGEIINAYRRITSILNTFSAELKKKHNITGPQAGTLSAIVEDGPISLTEVCQRTFRHISTVGGIVDRLEREGYVVKKRDVRDRRKVVLAATPKGKRLTSSAPFSDLSSAINAMERLPVKEILKINASMKTLLKTLGEELEEDT